MFTPQLRLWLKIISQPSSDDPRTTDCLWSKITFQPFACNQRSLLNSLPRIITSQSSLYNQRSLLSLLLMSSDQFSTVSLCLNSLLNWLPRIKDHFSTLCLGSMFIFQSLPYNQRSILNTLPMIKYLFSTLCLG